MREQESKPTPAPFVVTWEDGSRTEVYRARYGDLHVVAHGDQDADDDTVGIVNVPASAVPSLISWLQGAYGEGRGWEQERRALYSALCAEGAEVVNRVTSRVVEQGWCDCHAPTASETVTVVGEAEMAGARVALTALHARKGEDVGAWAARITSDMVDRGVSDRAPVGMTDGERERAIAALRPFAEAAAHGDRAAVWRCDIDGAEWAVVSVGGKRLYPSDFHMAADAYDRLSAAPSPPVQVETNPAGLTLLRHPRDDEDMEEAREDVDRMRRVLRERGYDAGDRDVFDAWCDYSEDRSASFICLPPETADGDAYVFDVLIRGLCPAGSAPSSPLQTEGSDV